MEHIPTYRLNEKVVMHTCLESDHYGDKVWTCRSDSFIEPYGLDKQEVVFLEGLAGYFLCQFLKSHTDHGTCMEKGCNHTATTDYNGHGHWVCQRCDDSLNRYFEEEYR